MTTKKKKKKVKPNNCNTAICNKLNTPKETLLSGSLSAEREASVRKLCVSHYLHLALPARNWAAKPSEVGATANIRDSVMI